MTGRKPPALGRHLVAPTLCAAAVVCGLLHAPMPARAASVCIPAATGVPRDPGPPEWWGVVTGRRDDPRWKGATGVGHSLNRGRFLALHAVEGAQEFLYLRWELRGATGGTAEDYLHFGFVDPQTVTGVAFRITIPTVTGNPVDQQPIAASQVQWRRKVATGVAWSALQLTDVTTAPWIQATGRHWVDCPGNCDSFLVQLRIPIDPSATPNDIASGLPLGDDFLFWYDMMVTPNGTPPPTVHHTFPEGHPYGIANFLDPTYPSAADWAECRVNSTVDCRPGVSLDPPRIFATHGVSTDPTDTITDENTFHATPRNDSGGALPGDAVAAAFRIADWDADFADAAWNGVTGCGAATGTGSVSDGADFDLACTWDPDLATLCEYRPGGAAGEVPPWDECAGPGTKSPDQWILVDLSAGPGATGDVFFPVALAGRAFSFFQEPPTSVLPPEAAVRALLHPGAPNPFTSATTIRFETARAGPVTLTIYDVAGRITRTLLQEDRAAGAHRISWDGRNDRGARVPAGRYFCRLRAGGVAVTRELILVR